MRALTFEPASFDLLWCEGAAYIMGVESALRAWRPLLREGGCLSFTDAVWLTDSPPQTLRAWWEADYPAMQTARTGPDRVVDAGYELCGHFVLLESAWWDDYYKPMEARLASLRLEMEGDPRALAALEEHQREIDYYRRWSEHYGYQFVVARKAD
jgi:SAM-dependent methyltransferase